MGVAVLGEEKGKKGFKLVERQEHKVSGIMSEMEFGSLELSEMTTRGIEELGFKHMTEVQARTIPHLLAGRDVLGAARTGRALSFLLFNNLIFITIPSFS